MKAITSGQPPGGPPTASASGAELRGDLAQVAHMIPAGSRVLDVGCGDGALLDYLVRQRGVDGRGLELEQEGVNASVARGLFVIQGDADTDLAAYPDASFDIVILSRTLQTVRRPRDVLSELLRIGREAIVTIPNFGHWPVRLSLALRGRMPVTRALSKSWYDTDNIHFCTISDLIRLADEENAQVTEFAALSGAGRRLTLGPRFANFWAAQALMKLKRR